LAVRSRSTSDIARLQHGLQGHYRFRDREFRSDILFLQGKPQPQTAETLVDASKKRSPPMVTFSIFMGSIKNTAFKGGVF
jgi:hypothetical protein